MCSSVPFKYTVIAPVLPSGWVLLGETNKFVTVSSQRFITVQADATSLFLSMQGVPGEQVELWLVNSSNEDVKVTCTMHSTGNAFLGCTPANGCRCT
mgnify:FL=1